MALRRSPGFSVSHFTYDFENYIKYLLYSMLHTSSFMKYFSEMGVCTVGPNLTSKDSLSGQVMLNWLK